MSEEPFETETMADLHARQGRPGEAVAILRRLAESHPEHPALPGWRARIADLEKLAGSQPELPNLPADVPIPSAPGVTAVAGRNRLGIAEAIVTWALPPTPGPPVLEILLVLRDANGVEATRRRLPVTASSGRVAFPAERACAIAAAAGYIVEGDRFIAVARSTAS